MPLTTDKKVSGHFSRYKSTGEGRVWLVQFAQIIGGAQSGFGQFKKAFTMQFSDWQNLFFLLKIFFKKLKMNKLDNISWDLSATWKSLFASIGVDKEARLYDWTSLAGEILNLKLQDL